MPASTLHKSAQQGAPEAYISMCRSTTKDTRVQKIRASASLRASKRCPRRPRHTRVEGIRASTSSCVRQRWPRQHGRMQRCTRRPCCPHREDARVWVVTELRPSLRCLRSSSHVLPHDQEQREEGVLL